MTGNLPRHRERTDREYIDEPRSHRVFSILAVVLFGASAILLWKAVFAPTYVEATWYGLAMGACFCTATVITITAVGYANRGRR